MPKKAHKANNSHNLSTGKLTKGRVEDIHPAFFSVTILNLLVAELIPRVLRSSSVFSPLRCWFGVAFGVAVALFFQITQLPSYPFTKSLLPCRLLPVAYGLVLLTE
jgi:hypothetical protein